MLDGTASVDDTAFRYGYGDAGLVHNTGTLRKTGTGAAVAEATIDNDGVIEVLDGRLELPELLNWSGPMFSGAGTLAGGTYVVGNGAALLLPGPLKANAARLALGAGSQVLYNELTGTGVQVRDGLGGLLRNAGGGVLELTGGAFAHGGGHVRQPGRARARRGLRAQQRAASPRPRARSCARRSPPPRRAAWPRPAPCSSAGAWTSSRRSRSAATSPCSPARWPGRSPRSRASTRRPTPRAA